MNALSSMVDAILKAPAVLPRVAPPKGNKTALLRHLLREGPATSQELARRSGMEASLVRSLLKWDINHGRIRIVGNVYRIAADYDEQESRRIYGAMTLLRLRGYKITKIE